MRGLLISLISAKVNRAKCVHFHFFHATALEYLCVRLAKLLGLRVVATIHDVESLCGDSRGGLQRRILNASDAIVAHNMVSFNELIDIVGVPECKVSRIRHGNYIDSIHGRVDMATARRKLDLPPNAIVGLMFGQIKTAKGLDILLEALPKVVAKFPEFYLVIAGKPWKDDFARYQASIERLDIASRVRADIRYIPDDEASLYHSATDIVLLPYRKVYQSGVLLMAMSWGLPIIASDIPGMSELITHGDNGFLFRSGNPDSLSNVLIEALGDPDARGSAAKKALETARTHDWSLIGQELAGVYATL